MGIEWNESKRKYEWEGDVAKLVAVVGDGDARMGFVLDKESGAKIAMNINGLDGATEDDEPFYIESPDGDNLYDAYNRKEAIMILSNISKGKKYPDMPDEPKPKTKKRKAKRTRAKKTTTGISGSRR